MAAERTPTRRVTLSATRLLLFLGLAVAGIVYTAGIRQNLPYFTEVDETTRVVNAIRMVGNWDLNPHWFGHPSSTVFYPLALVYYLWNVLANGGPLWGPDPALQSLFQSDQTPYYLLARGITIAYGLLSLPVVYLVGRRVFGERAAVLALWMTCTYTILIAHAQIARDDSAGLFFAMLTLWFSLRLYDAPTLRNRFLTGTAIGLAAASRYFLIAFILPLLVVEASILWRQRRTPGEWPKTLAQAAAGVIAVGLAFAVSTPFFFLDFATAQANLIEESRTVHLGADGLSPIGNFGWYFGTAIPRSITWLHLLLAGAGTLLAIVQRRPLPVALAGIAVAFVAGLSLHGLHWQRWIIQALPILAMLGADAALRAYDGIASRLRLSRPAAVLSFGLVLALVLAIPLLDMLLFTVRQATPSTRLRSKEWVLNNVPPGSKIAFEHYSIPLGGTPYVEDYRQSLAKGMTIQAYRQQGYHYLAVSDEIYNRYLVSPERYPAEAAFYGELFSTVPLAQEFLPTPARPGTERETNLAHGRSGGGGGGPVILVFRLSEP